MGGFQERAAELGGAAGLGRGGLGLLIGGRRLIGGALHLALALFVLLLLARYLALTLFK